MLFTDKIHLVSDVSIEELHAFAKKIGLKRCWFHGVKKGHPHYDLKNAKGSILYDENFDMYISKALRNGASPVTKKEIVEANHRRKWKNPPCKKHKMASHTMGYVQHANWAEAKVKRGHHQRECRICGRYLFKCEE